MRSTRLRVALAAASAFTLMATAVCAQTAAPAGAGGSTRPAASETPLEEITITGSRLITNGNDFPTPVTVVNPAELSITKPTTVFENLSNLPVFSGSYGASIPPDNAPNGNFAYSALNVRNLGPLRALVLFDGHRVPPTSADGLVDINMLPQLLLQRVEVVTGGASAIYGSDAITGVINFIPDRKFNGVKVDMQRGISTYGDARSYRIGLAGGTELFGGRGHIEASFERYNDDGILWRKQRPWTNGLWTLQGDGSAATPFHLQDNVTIANVTFGGIIVCPFGPSVPALCPGQPLVGQTFDSNGVLTPLQRGPRGPDAGLVFPFLQIGGGGAYHIGVSLKSPARQDQFFGRFDYDLTDNIRAFVSVSGAVDHALGYAGSLRSFPPGWSIGSCNAFLAGQYQQALGCTNQNDPNQPTFTFSRMYNPDLEGGLAQLNEVWVHDYFVMSGLEGKFGSGYHWDATYTHSQSRANTRGDRNQNLSHLYAALDAVTDPATGKVVCNVTLTNPGLYPGCVPINVFGPTAPSPEALNYVFGRIETLTTNTLDDLSGSVRGAPFNDWAGPVGIALSAEVKRQTYEMTSSSLPTDFVDCTPLRFGNCTPGATTVFINSNAPRSPVHQTVAEAAVELNVPLLKDLPFIKDLSTNSAARYTRYNNSSGGDPNLASTSFNAATWKVGLTWAMTDWLTLRWARSRDFRAPNLYDLYNPLQLIPNQIVTDYLTGTNPNPVQRFGGNPHLRPEVGYTSTLGVIFHPTAQFSLAIDGYDISIRDALAFIDGSTQFIQQACIASGGASPLCALQIRPFGCCSNMTTANQMTAYVVEPFNIAGQHTWGIDVEMNYNTRLFERVFSIRTLLTRQPHLNYSQPDIGRNDQAGVAYNQTFTLLPAPAWKASMFVHYEATSRIGVDVAERYRSRLHWNADPNQYAVGGAASVAYTDLTLSYTIPHAEDQFSFFVNVQNAFNKQPPPAPNPLNAIFPGIAPLYAAGDDVVGRYWTVGVRARF